MPTYSPSVAVYIDGDLVADERIEVHTRHGLDLPIATATIVLSIPRPASAVFNKVVEIHAQIAANPSRIFQGVIRADSDSLDESGFTATLNCQGWGYILAQPINQDYVWMGPIDARQVIRSVLHIYGFGNQESGNQIFHCPVIADADGVEIVLGGNSSVDGGQVRFEKGESGLNFILRICNLFGYHACDTPDGVFYIIRAIGVPPEPPDHIWNEGEDVLSLVKTRDAGPVYNWIEVTGATPTPADGTTGIPYRSFPAVVSANDLIPAPGAKFMGISDDLLISDDLCDSVRTIAEIRYNSEDPATMYEWTDIGHPRFRPGRSMALLSTTLDIDVTVWLYSISQDITADGYWETFSGRADLGTALEAGEDLCVDIDLIEGPIHLGDETRANYDVPAAFGTSAYGEFNPSDTVSSMTLTYEGHGINSYLIGGLPSMTEVSTYLLEQPVGTEIASGLLPQMAETSGAPVWDDIELPIAGSLEAGTTARLTFLAGQNPAATAGPYDDFEIRNVSIRICDEGDPVLPDEDTNPEIPPPKPDPPVSVCARQPADATVTNEVNYGPLTVPAGTSWIWITGNVTDATGLYWFNGTYAAQGYTFLGAGYGRFMVEPGTASEFVEAPLNGTPVVGSGPFETFYRISVGGLVTAQTVPQFYVRTITDSNVDTIPFSLSDVCVRFLGPTEWPY